MTHYFQLAPDAVANEAYFEGQIPLAIVEKGLYDTEQRLDDQHSSTAAGGDLELPEQFDEVAESMFFFNGTETEATVTVLYGRIVGVFPPVLLSSRWIPLPYVMIIIGENTGFNATSTPTFTPDDSITTIVKIGLGNMMGVLLLVSPNSDDGSVDLAVTTTNGEGQEVTFTKEDAFRINLLPFILDEKGNKPLS